MIPETACKYPNQVHGLLEMAQEGEGRTPPRLRMDAKVQLMKVHRRDAHHAGREGRGQ